MPRVLLIDNYDSVTWNLAHDLGRTGASVHVHRNDRITIPEIHTLAPTHIVLSPGPGRPERPADFGICADILAHFPTTPLLGVCLGHQGMAWHLGARVVHAPVLMHGKTSEIRHHGRGLFADQPSPMQVMRYHSLIVDRSSLPDALEVTAETDDGLVMAIAHRSRPWWGVQFHPESVGSPTGPQLAARFLEMSAHPNGAPSTGDPTRPVCAITPDG
jgi:anthranilate synthase component 2